MKHPLLDLLLPQPLTLDQNLTRLKQELNSTPEAQAWLENIKSAHYRKQCQLLKKDLPKIMQYCHHDPPPTLFQTTFIRIIKQKNKDFIHNAKRTVCFESMWVLLGAGLLAFTAELTAGPPLLIAAFLVLAYSLYDSKKNLKELIETSGSHKNKTYATVKLCSALFGMSVALAFTITQTPLIAAVALYGGYAALTVITATSLCVLCKYMFQRHAALMETKTVLSKLDSQDSTSTENKTSPAPASTLQRPATDQTKGNIHAKQQAPAGREGESEDEGENSPHL